MFSKSANARTYSLRRRTVLLVTATGVFFALLAGILIFSVSWRYLMTQTHDRITRLVVDLQREYEEYKGATPEFIHCMDEDADEHNVDLTFALLSTPDGRVIHATPMPERIRKHIVRAATKGRHDLHFYTERDKHSDRHVAIRMKTLETYDGNFVTVARDVTLLERYLIFLAATLGAMLLLNLLFTGLVAYVLGTHLVRRLRAIASTATAIEGGDWSRRVADGGTGAREIQALVHAFNGMCDKNEKTLNELRVLTDNIAHDLRTPLARLGLAAETAATGGTLREPLADLVADETSAMLEMINTMLAISQTDAQIDRSPRTDVDLGALVHELRELYEPLAEQGTLALTVTTPESPVLFSGHRAKLQQLVGNLVENAIKYTPCCGAIQVTLATDDTHIRLIVSDTGCGIAPADIPHIFTRFWRADSSRTLPGNGLGLALVQAIVTSYGGHIACTSELSKGTTFTVTLPRT